MKKILLLLLFMNALPQYGQTPANDPHWQFVWGDEFTTTTINTSKWLVQNNFDHYGGEPQVYTSRVDNVFISAGTLILRVKQETYSCPSSALTSWGCARQLNTGQPYSYTSGWVESKQPYNTKSGYIESRIKLPHAQGYWPAFWTFIGDGVTGGSNAAEIDIFEMLGNNPPNISGTNIHLQYCPPSCPVPNYGQDVIPTGFNYTSWHTYGLEWSPSKFIWYIDGSPVRILDNPGIIDPVRTILNFALAPWSPPNGSTPFPADMVIDYVRVYDVKKDCNTVLNVCGYNFSTHDNKVKKEIIIGNGSCSNSLNIGNNVYLRASTNGVLINGDFTCPDGAQLYIDANTCQ